MLDVSCLGTFSESFMICHRSCMLQADSEKLRQAWIKAVQTSIATAYREKGDESEVSLTIHQTTTPPLGPENFKYIKPLLMRGKEKIIVCLPVEM